VDESSLLREGNKLARCQLAEDRVLPPCESLHRDDRISGQIDLGLEERDYLPALNRANQIMSEGGTL